MITRLQKQKNNMYKNRKWFYMVREILNKYGLKLKRGFDRDTVTVSGADPETVYREIAEVVDGYVSIDRMGSLIIFNKR